MNQSVCLVSKNYQLIYECFCKFPLRFLISIFGCKLQVKF